MRTYQVDIAGIKRDLQVFPINEKVAIAAFILFGDVEITEHSAKKLLEKVPEFDVILTPEAKAIPLAYEMSRQSGKKYVVARKAPKLYMGNPFCVEVKSITTEKEQKLYLGDDDILSLENKRVLIVDDVISTGESLKAVIKLCEKVGGEVAGKCAVFIEGDEQGKEDVIYLSKIPLLDVEK